MTSEPERPVEGERFRRIHEAFRRGDLDGLRSAVGDGALIPNGRMPDSIGSCLSYAISHSPVAFIRTLLELGADPNAPADDGFPSLVAVLASAQAVAGATARTDVIEILRLLLAFGADPNQRGINDYTPLHMAVATRNREAIRVLLDGGADPQLTTRIDECETPREMAEAAGLGEMAAMLGGSVPQVRRRLRSGLMLLADHPGSGALVRRQHRYHLRLRFWLNKGDEVRWTAPWGAVGVSRLEDEGTTLVTDVRIDRRSLIGGLYYGVEGMRVGGTRRLEIAPHLAYGERGVPGVIPADALLIAEISVLEAAR